MICIIFIYRYDHLSKVLTKVLDERPSDVVDIIEDISKETKRSQFKSDVDTVQDKIDRSTEVALCQIQEKLFKVCLHDNNRIHSLKSLCVLKNLAHNHSTKNYVCLLYR